MEFDQDQNRYGRHEHDAPQRKEHPLMTAVLAQHPGMAEFRLDPDQPNVITDLQRLEP